MDLGLFPLMIEDETQRLLIYNNVTGRKIRFQFSNTYGRYPLCIEKAVAACARDDGTVDCSTNAAITFGGKRSLNLAPGESCYSDEIDFLAYPGQWISVSTYIKEKTKITGSASCMECFLTKAINSYAGDFCEEGDFSVRPQSEYHEFLNFKPGFQCFYAVNQLDVFSEENVRTIVAFGDSITHHGFWTQALARRLYGSYPGKISLINRGISGNRILHDASTRSFFGAFYGIRGLDRFEKDIFGCTVNRVDMVIAMEGINDILHPTVGISGAYESVQADKIIEGLRQFAAITHKHGAKIICCTLLPYKNFQNIWTEKDNKLRSEVNNWIRNNMEFDGVFDYDSFVRSCKNPDCLADDYDSGDNLHPGVAGGQRIAECIDTEALYAKLFYRITNKQKAFKDMTY